MACPVGGGKTVEGFLYEAFVVGRVARGNYTRGYDTWQVFVPSKKLLLLEQGEACFSSVQMTSKKGTEVLDQLLDIDLPDGQLKERIQKADEEARRAVQIPTTIVDEICDALRSNPAAENSSKDKYVNEKVKEIFKQVWACNKPLDG